MYTRRRMEFEIIENRRIENSIANRNLSKIRRTAEKSASRSGGREGDFDSKRVVAGAKKAIACPSQGDS